MNQLECTCTVLWLIKYSVFYYGGRDEAANRAVISNLVKCADFLSNGSVAACGFEEKFANCSSQQINTSHAHSDYFLGGGGGGGLQATFYHLKWLKYVVEVFIRPCMCLLGLVTNYLTIRVIRHYRLHPKNSKHTTNKMYTHISVNSLFNIAYCLVNVLALVNICIFPRTSYCSAYERSEASQYLKIYVVLFVGNTVSLACNFSYIFVSLSRFFESTSSKSRVYHKLESLSLRRVYCALFFVCCMFSSFQLFQFEINKFVVASEANFPFDAFGLNYCGMIRVRSNPALNWRCNAFVYLNMTNNVLNNIVFLLVSVAIDVFQ